MQILIAGGTGFIGQALTEHWLKQGHDVTILGRTHNKMQRIFVDKVHLVSWEQMEKTHADVLRKQDVLVNLCGASIGAKRWTRSRRAQVLSSRIHTTRSLTQWCVRLGKDSPRLLNAGAIGVYGLHTMAQGLPEPYTEAEDIRKAPTDFLAEVGRFWERATELAEHSDVKLVKMRFAVVLARHGGALPEIVRPFYFGFGGTIGSGTQPFTWITLSDLCRAIDFILEHPEITGPINLTAPGCVSQSELAKAIGKVLHRPTFFRTPAFAIKCLFGQMGEELLLKGQHVRPKRLLDMGFTFKYPDIQTALQSIYDH